MNRERRIILGALTVAVVFTIVAAVVRAAWPERNTGHAGSALWLFGFDTVRVDVDHLGNRKALGFPGFGQVIGSRGDVYMFDAIAGRLGVLRGSTNRVTDLAHVPTAYPRGAVEPAPSFAVGRDTVWLVAQPGVIRQFDLQKHHLGAPITLPARAPASTRIVATPDSGAVAVFGDGTQTKAVRLDAGGRVVRVQPLAGTAPGGIVSVSADGNVVWVVTAHGRATALDASTLGVRASVDVPHAVPGGVGAAAGAGGALWVVALDRADLDRIDPATGEVTARIPYLATPRAFREPTQLVATPTDVWLLAPTNRLAVLHDARVIRVPLQDRRVSESIDTPSALFVGGIAVS